MLLSYGKHGLLIRDLVVQFSFETFYQFLEVDLLKHLPKLLITLDADWVQIVPNGACKGEGGLGKILQPPTDVGEQIDFR